MLSFFSWSEVSINMDKGIWKGYIHPALFFLAIFWFHFSDFVFDWPTYICFSEKSFSIYIYRPIEYKVHSKLDKENKSLRPFLFTISNVICLVNPQNGSWVLFTTSQNSLCRGSLYRGLSVLPNVIFLVHCVSQCIFTRYLGVNNQSFCLNYV